MKKSPSKPKRKGVRGSRHAPPTNAFPKGHPGGPGRPKDDPEFIAACRDKTPKALATLERAMDSFDEHPAPAVKAAEVLLNRGWGTAPATIKLDVKADVTQQTTHSVALPKPEPKRLQRIASVLQKAGVLDALNEAAAADAGVEALPAGREPETSADVRTEELKA